MQNGRQVNRSELAAVFGVSLTTVDTWVRAAMPVVQPAAGKGKPWIFDTAAVNRWREQRAAAEAAGQEVQDEAALRLRKLAAEAKSAELKLAHEMNLVAPLDEVERTWSRILSEVQSTLRGRLIVRLASQLVGETNERTFKRIALEEVDAVLQSLSEMEIDESDEDSEVARN